VDLEEEEVETEVVSEEVTVEVSEVETEVVSEEEAVVATEEEEVDVVLPVEEVE
jgi:hypothetical protein